MTEQNKNTEIAKAADHTANMQKLNDAKIVPIKANLEPWAPSEPGEILTGIFKGIETITMPSLQREGVTDHVNAAVFYVQEPVIDKDTGEHVDNQLVQKTVAARRLVSFFESKQAGTIWRIIYKGQEKNKTNSRKSNVYDFYQMTTENE
jgi:hypothetical protein